MPAHAQRGGGMARGGGGGVAGQTAGSSGTFVPGQTTGGGAFMAGPGMAGGTFVAGRGPGGRVFIAAQPGARGFVHGADGFPRHPFFRHPFFFHRGFNSFGTVVVVGGPWGFWPSSDPSLYNQPQVYSPPPTYDNSLSLSPQYPPMPSVVEFPTGRYELRGDGRTEPYHWVWIPKPPTAPPAEPSSPAPPSPAPPTSGDPGPTRRTPVYRWTDEQGTVHLTDQLTAVPDRYRAKAKRGEPS
jgi:hypothetical protein